MQVIAQTLTSARPKALSSRTRAVSTLCAPARRRACSSSGGVEQFVRVSCSASSDVGRRAVLALPAVLLVSKALEASAGPIVNPEPLNDGFLRYYGKATAVSSYAGYGGNDNNDNQFKYYFDIPDKGWAEGKVNKVDKSTNGTDVRFLKGSGKSASKIYLTTLAGYSRLKADRKGIISDLALSDYDLQDAVDASDVFTVSEREKDGQTYVDYLIESPGVSYMITVTTDGSRIYALFGQGGSADYPSFKRAISSFTTINVNL